MSEIAKLKALRDSVSFCLYTYHNGVTQYFDPKTTEDLFLRYNSLSDVLKSKNPSYFEDLPVRNFKSSGTTDYEGRGYFTRNSLEVLLMDIDYCLRILSELTTVDIPSMKVTREGLFFSGQYFDAIQRVGELLSNAQQSIIIIDGYIDQKVLDLMTVKKANVDVKILTKDVTPALRTAAVAFKKQYGGLSIRRSLVFHDRFIIVDDTDFYHFGASIKDLGNRGFMFSRIEEPEIVKSLLANFAQEWGKAQVEL